MEGATGRVDWPEVMPVMRWPMRTESGRSVPFILVEVRLVVKQVDLRGSAGLMQEDDPLGLGREIGKAQLSARLGVDAVSRGKAIPRQQRRERRDAQGNTRRALAEEMAPRHGKRKVMSVGLFWVHHEFIHSLSG